MKKTIITFAAFALLGAMAVSCQKENMSEPMSVERQTAKIYTVNYTVDGVCHQERLNGDEALDSFLHSLVAMTREGHHVHVQNVGSGQSVTKEVITFRTPDEDEAKAWIAAKLKEGYEVDMYFDTESEDYVCTATK